MKIRIRLSITIGDESTGTTTPTGPDSEAQIGTHHEVGYVDTGVGFTSPSMQPWEDDE